MNTDKNTQTRHLYKILVLNIYSAKHWPRIWKEERSFDKKKAEIRENYETIVPEIVKQLHTL